MEALLPPRAGQEGLDVQPVVETSLKLSIDQEIILSYLIKIGKNKENRVDRRGKENSTISDQPLSNQPRPIYRRSDFR